MTPLEIMLEKLRAGGAQGEAGMGQIDAAQAQPDPSGLSPELLAVIMNNGLPPPPDPREGNRKRPMMR
jgi:hypothetical protein